MRPRCGEALGAQNGAVKDEGVTRWEKAGALGVGSPRLGLHLAIDIH